MVSAIFSGKRIIYILIILTLSVSLKGFFQGFSEMQFFSDYHEDNEVDSDSLLINLESLVEEAELNHKTLHVLNCIHLNDKNKTGIIDEWEVNFKSVLSNAPLDNDLHIHVIANGDGSQMIKERIIATKLINESKWRNRISLTLYNAESKIKGWSEILKEKLRGHGTDKRVSIGGYFRLFAHTILEERGIDEVVYMDTDVVIIANLNDLVRSMNTTHEENESIMWQYAKSVANSGFMVLNMKKFHHFWDLISKLPQINSGGDQALLAQVVEQWPSIYNGVIPDQWNVHLGHGYRRSPHELLYNREHVGMLHFTGAYGDTYFEESIDKLCGGKYHGARCKGHLEEYHSSWGLAEMYIRLPWKFLIFFAATKIPHGNDGFSFNFEIIDC